MRLLVIILVLLVPGRGLHGQADADGDGGGDACENGVVLADIDGSGRVDGFDLGRLARAFGSSDGQAAYDRRADLDRDQDVDGLDLALLAASFGASPFSHDAPFPATPVLDSFNRASGLIGGSHPSATSWTHAWNNSADPGLPAADQVTITINGGQARSTQGDGNSGMETWNRFRSLNQEVYATLTSVQVKNQSNSLMARIQTIDNITSDPAYHCEFLRQGGPDLVAIYRRRAGVALDDVTLVQRRDYGGPEFAPGHVLGMRVTGKGSGNVRVSCYLNGVMVADVIDQGQAGGSIDNPGFVGLAITDDAAARFDNFGGGPLGNVALLH